MTATAFSGIVFIANYLQISFDRHGNGLLG